MKIFYRIFYLFLFSFLFCFHGILSVQANESLNLSFPQGIQCKHFWEKAGELTASGRPVGEDVGEPPDASFEHVGTYRCRMYLSFNDVKSGKFVFVGEVGDASYLQVTGVNGKSVNRLSVNHGLTPDLVGAVYMRYVPFVVAVRDIFVQEGVHDFIIRYKDIVPHQVGIRSGVPTIETILGAFKRALRCSPAFTFHLFQMIFFCLLAISFFSWPKMKWNARMIYTAASLSGVWVILQVSAIPRSFLSPVWAIRLNDFSQIASFPIFGAALLQIFTPTKKKTAGLIIVIHSLMSGLAIAILVALESSDKAYIAAWGAMLLALGGFPCFLLGYSILRKSVVFTAGPNAPRSFGYVYCFLALLYAFDITNLIVFNSRYYYFNHFLFFSTMLWSIWRIQLHVSPNEVKLRSDLDFQSRKAYSIVADAERGEDVDALGVFTKGLASFLRSDRISIQEVSESRLKFLGHFGEYLNIQGLHEIRVPSLVGSAIATGHVQYGRMLSRQKNGGESDVLVIPLENNSKVIGVLSATEFSDGRLPQFYKDRIDIIKRECEPVLSLLIAERHSRSKDRLIQMIRNRTHGLQLRSEEYFLKNFDISTSFQAHAFIYGDLVGSVDLNERYKDSKSSPVESAVDEHLGIVWEKFKHLGLVVSRTKGDLISFIVPNLASDTSEKDAVLRCYEIIRYLSLPSSNRELQDIGKKHLISLSLKYRFAMSVVQKALLSSRSDLSLKAFNLLIDEAIDAAARVVSGIALDGECLVMEPARELLSSHEPLLELEAQRVKGKSIPVRLWTLNGGTVKNAA